MGRARATAWDEITQTIPRGTEVLQVASVHGAGQLMIPFGLIWDGADTQWASVQAEGMSFDSSGLVAHDRIGEGMWGREGRDQDAVAFVRLVLTEDAPARADGSLGGGQGVICEIKVAFAQELTLKERDDLSVLLVARYQAPVSEISLEETKRLVPALKRRRREQRRFRYLVWAISPFAVVFGLIAWPFITVKEALERRKQ